MKLRTLLLAAFLLLGISAFGQITLVGGCAAVATNCTPVVIGGGVFATGQFEYTFAFRTALTSPSLATNYTSIANVSSNTSSYRSGCAVMTSATPFTNAWTNATQVVTLIYSGVAATTTATCVTAGLGGKSTQTGTTSTYTYQTLTMTHANASSWVIGAMGSSAATCTPATVLHSEESSTNIIGNDTNGVVSSFGTLTCTGTAGNWHSDQVELLAAAAATPTVDTNGGTFGTSATTTLSCATPSSTICYSKDGLTTPAAATSGTCSAGSTYSSSLTLLQSGQVVKALCTLAGLSSSAVTTSSAFTLNPFEPNLASMGESGGALIPVTIGTAHASTNNGASSLATVAVGPITPIAGTVLDCLVKYNFTSAFVSVTDNVNASPTPYYQPAWSRLRESNHTFHVGEFFRENVAGSATTITLTIAGAQTNGEMACRNFLGTPQFYTEDSTVRQSGAGTAVNPAPPNSYTPFGNGELVLSGGNITSGSPSGPPPFVLLDNAGTMYPEYWSQGPGPAAATTGAFVDTTSTAYGLGMTAFAPNMHGFCDNTVFFDWAGGTTGNAPSTGTLATSSHGMTGTPNADAGFNTAPGWTVTTTGLTYDSNAYMPAQTVRQCPFYTGSGTTVAAVGLKKINGSSNTGAANFWFETFQPRVSLAACLYTTTPVSNNGSQDTMLISGGDQNVGNGDYVNFAFGANGTGHLTAEFKAGSVVAATTWTQSTTAGEHAILIREEFNKANDFVISSWAIDGSNNATFTGTYAAGVYPYLAGEQLIITGLTTGSFMNGQLITVASSTGTVGAAGTFTGTFTHATTSATEAGGAGHIHKMYIYTFPSPKCVGTPTLAETVLATGFIAGGGFADKMEFFSNTNSFTADGNAIYVGWAAGDAYYGAQIVP